MSASEGSRRGITAKVSFSDTPAVKHKPLPKDLCEYLEVCDISELGVQSGLVWIKSPGGGKFRGVGNVAGTRSYRQDRTDWYVCLRQTNYLVSRVVYFLGHGVDPGDLTVDHVDRNPLNNNLSNLRLADYLLQSNNTRQRCSHSGVYWNTQKAKWQAAHRFNGKKNYLGRFDCLLEASSAYNASVALHTPEVSECKTINISELRCGCLLCEE